jgi:hypothetical protein
MFTYVILSKVNNVVSLVTFLWQNVFDIHKEMMNYVVTDVKFTLLLALVIITFALRADCCIYVHISKMNKHLFLESLFT